MAVNVVFPVFIENTSSCELRRSVLEVINFIIDISPQTPGLGRSIKRKPITLMSALLTRGFTRTDVSAANGKQHTDAGVRRFQQLVSVATLNVVL